MTPQQARPTQTGTQAFSVKKVLVAKRGVLSDSHTVGIQLGAWQNSHVETHDFHLPSECSFQMSYEVCMHAVSPCQKRRPGLQQDDEHYNPQCWFPPLLQHSHLARKFRRLIRKKVGALLQSEQGKWVSDNGPWDWSKS